MGLGMAVLIRGGAGGALVIVALLFLSGAAGPWFDLEHPVLDMLTWPLMYVPVLLLAHRHLLRPAALGFRDALGLRVVPGGARHLALVALALVAGGALVTTLLTLAGHWLGLTSHWSEWFDEELAFGDATAILANAVGSVVLAPVFEEVVFRGILFATLRERPAGRPRPSRSAGPSSGWPTATARWGSWTSRPAACCGRGPSRRRAASCPAWPPTPSPTWWSPSPSSPCCADRRSGPRRRPARASAYNTSP